MSWLFFPPFFTIPATILFALIGDRGNVQPVPGLIWGGALAVYLCLCVLSAYFVLGEQEAKTDLGLIFFLSQGLILIPVVLALGAPVFFAWGGFIILLGALSLSFYRATQIASGASAVSPSDSAAPTPNEIIDKIPLATCVTNNKGALLHANSPFYAALEQPKELLQNNPINEIIPINEETVELDTGLWWIQQEHFADRYLFFLCPTEHCQPQLSEQVQTQKSFAAPVIAGSGPFDEYGFLSPGYMEYRTTEEIERARRYRRWLSVLLLGLGYNPSSPMGIGSLEQGGYFKTFAKAVKPMLRNVDIGFAMNEQNRVLILLPETPLSGAKSLLGRLSTVPREVFEDSLRESLGIRVVSSVQFYNGANPLDFPKLMSILEESFEAADKVAS